LKVDKVLLETFVDEKFGSAFGVSKDKMEMARRVLIGSPCNFVVEFS
jgi:hypothetical protein